MVEDNEDVCTVFAHAFEIAKIESLIAKTGAEAKVMFARYQPACVIIDLGLPDVNGLEVAQYIREHPSAAQTTIGLLTGGDYADVEAESQMLGIEGFFRKPTRIGSIVSWIQKKLGQQSTPPA